MVAVTSPTFTPFDLAYARSQVGVERIDVEVGHLERDDEGLLTNWWKFAPMVDAIYHRHTHDLDGPVHAAISLKTAAQAVRVRRTNVRIVADERTVATFHDGHMSVERRLRDVVIGIIEGSEHPFLTSTFGRPDSIVENHAPSFDVGHIDALRHVTEEAGLKMVYADGSFIGKPDRSNAMGWAWWTPEQHFAGSLYSEVGKGSRFHSSNIAELRAVDAAARDAYPGEDIVVATDSAFVMDRRGRRVRKSGRDVILAKVTGHCDPHGHNRADRLALHASQEAWAQRD